MFLKGKRKFKNKYIFKLDNALKILKITTSKRNKVRRQISLIRL